MLFLLFKIYQAKAFLGQHLTRHFSVQTGSKLALRFPVFELAFDMVE